MMPYGNSLLSNLSFLIGNASYSDIRLRCSDSLKLFHANKIILAARSEMFDRLLFGGFHENTADEIPFPEISSAVMRFIIEYIYSEQVENLTINIVLETYHAANYFLLYI